MQVYTFRSGMLYYKDTYFIVPYFFVFQERIHEGNEFMKHLIVIVTFSSTKKLYALETPMECLNSDFIEVHAQAGVYS